MEPWEKALLAVVFLLIAAPLVSDVAVSIIKATHEMPACTQGTKP